MVKLSEGSGLMGGKERELSWKNSASRPPPGPGEIAWDHSGKLFSNVPVPYAPSLTCWSTSLPSVRSGDGMRRNNTPGAHCAGGD